MPATIAAPAAREPARLSAGLTEAGTFEGYASLFGVADLGRDVVLRGAFADSIARRGAAGVKMLWQHETAEPIGRWLTIYEDSSGLYVRGRLNLAVARAREALALMREGALDGLSIGFRTELADMDRKTGLRRLRKVDLMEISLVTFPMLPQARVTSVKRRDEPEALAALRRENAALRWSRDALAVDLAIKRLGALEVRYAPDQPRDDIGRWTTGGSGGAGDLMETLVESIGNVIGNALSGGLTGAPVDQSGGLAEDVGFKPGAVSRPESGLIPTIVSCDALMNSDWEICKSSIFDDDHHMQGLCVKNMLIRNRECIRGLPLTPLLPY